MKPLDMQIPLEGEADAVVDAATTGVAPITIGELSGQLAGLSLPRQLYVLAIWPFFELLFNSLVGLVDTALAGRLGVAATNAIGASAYIGWLMGMLHMAVGVGAAALIARAVGAKHRRLANAALGQALLLATVWGVAIGLLAFAGAPYIARFFRLDDQALALCVTYLRVIAVAAPFSSILLVGAAALRAAGDTRSPFLAMLIVNLVNTASSVLFVFGPAPWGGHGVAGIAAGTTLAWTVGGILIIALLISGRGGIRLRLHRLRPHRHTTRRIIRVGVPSLIESSGMWIGNAIVGRIVGGLAAPAALGAHIIAIRIESLSFLPAIAVGTAAATLAGQYLGLGDRERAKQAVRLSWMIGSGIMTAMGVVFVLFPEPLARLMAPDKPELYELAAPLIRICGPVQFFFGTYLVLASALRGAGDTVVTMAMTYLSTFLVRLPLAYVLAVPMGLGLWGVWLGLCIELVVRGCLYVARFTHGGWLAVRV
jgi:putative MATE family efflux protein